MYQKKRPPQSGGAAVGAGHLVKRGWEAQRKSAQKSAVLSVMKTTQAA